MAFVFVALLTALCVVSLVVFLELVALLMIAVMVLVPTLGAWALLLVLPPLALGACGTFLALDRVLQMEVPRWAR